MRIESGYVSLRDVRFYAYHGVLPQERKVGAEFVVSLRVGCELAQAVASDSLDDTPSYAVLFDLMKREMAVPSQLLEHVAGRIGEAVFCRFPQVQSVDVWLSKVNPPMGADCGGAGVELHLINDKTCN